MGTDWHPTNIIPVCGWNKLPLVWNGLVQAEIAPCCFTLNCLAVFAVIWPTDLNQQGCLKTQHVYGQKSPLSCLVNAERIKGKNPRDIFIWVYLKKLILVTFAGNVAVLKKKPYASARLVLTAVSTLQSYYSKVKEIVNVCKSLASAS